MTKYRSARLVLTVQAHLDAPPGQVANTAYVYGAEVDPDNSNNHAITYTKIDASSAPVWIKIPRRLILRKSIPRWFNPSVNFFDFFMPLAFYIFFDVTVSLHEKLVPTLVSQPRMAIKADCSHKSPLSHRSSHFAHPDLAETAA